MTTHVERSIEVDVPVRAVYDQWTQFEDFPHFMAGVQQVLQVGDTLTHWVAEIAGVRREWDAEILEQVPDQKVAWAATSGATNAGTVYFDAVGENRTRVRLTLDYEPEGIVEKIGDVLDVVERQAVADLDRFKQFIESRGAATGGWRGTVADDGAPAVGADAAGAGGVAAADVARAGVQGAETVGDARSAGHGTDAERTGTAAGAATSAGVTGFGTDTGMSSSPTSGVLTGDPGARVASHAGTGTGDVGAGGADWTDQPGARDDVTEAATDPVGEDWAGEPGVGSTTAARPGAGSTTAGGDLTGASTDPVGESWDAGPSSTTTERDEDQDVEDRGVVTGMGGAHGAPASGPTSLDAADAPGPTRPSV